MIHKVFIGAKSSVKIFIVVLLFFCSSSATLAAPIINTVSVSLSHKNNISITGSGFGAKSPAAPRIWDAMDDTVLGSEALNTYYPGDRYPRACSGPGETPYLTEYRTSFHGFSTMPNSRTTKFISAAATTCNGSWASEQSDSLFTTAAWEADTLFLTYYYRMSPTWGLETNNDGCPDRCVGDNLKEVSANGCEVVGSNLCGTYLNDTDTYIDWCNGQTPMIRNPLTAYMRGATTAGVESCSTGNYVNTPNPMQGWVHMEYYWDNSRGYKAGYSNGTGVAIAPNWAARFLNSASGTNAKTISIGGFSRWPRANATGNYRYWAGIYADITYSRVMLGNNPNWDLSTIREPQIPSQWADGSITFSANLGSFPSSGNAYLFVFDSSNSHNTVGYRVALGSSGGDTTPPSPPSGLMVS